MCRAFYNPDVTDPIRRYPHREGVLLIAAMILSGILTVSVSVWILNRTDLIGMSVREVPDDERLQGPRMPAEPVPSIRPAE